MLYVYSYFTSKRSIDIILCLCLYVCQQFFVINLLKYVFVYNKQIKQFIDKKLQTKMFKLLLIIFTTL